AGILILLGLIPGMPHVAFLGLGLAAAGAAWMIWKKQSQIIEEEGAYAGRGKVSGGVVRQGGDVISDRGGEGPALPAPGEGRELGWDDVACVDSVGLEVGYRLIPLVAMAQAGQLLSRIKGVRKKLSQDMGFLMPSVHIRDNLDLMPN